MILRVLLPSILLGLSTVLLAQDNFCGTFELDEKFISDYYETYQFQDQRYAPMRLPLFIHLLGSDEGTGHFPMSNVMRSLCTLNEDFAPYNIQFYVAGMQKINKTSWYNHDNFRDGEDMMRTNNVDDVINCYFVSNPANNCGYYSYRGDAVALNHGCLNTDHTWAHELGHFFSLPHTFFGWEGIRYIPGSDANNYTSQVSRGIESIVDPRCSRVADRICDTPPDYISSRWSCNDDNESPYDLKDLNGEIFRADGSYFMSYASDGCMSRFSPEQINRVVSNLMNSRTDIFQNQLSNPNFLPAGPINIIAPTDSAVVGYKAIEFIWEDMPNADGYIFELSRFRHMLAAVDRREVTTNRVLIDSLYPGRTYYWRVMPVSKVSFCNGFTDTRILQIDKLTSTRELDDKSTVKLIKNVVHSFESIYLSTEESSAEYRVSLISINGQMAWRSTIRARKGLLELKPDDLAQDIYILSVVTDNKNYQFKILVQ